MQYQVKDFSALLGMHGFSDVLLKQHFKLYEGYVTNVNKLLAMDGAERRAGKGFQFADWHGHFGFEFNGMRLHELYFANLTKAPVHSVPAALLHKFTESFGSYAEWAKEFKAAGSQRGVGWAVLYYDAQNGTLLNQWTIEHHINHYTGCVPLLVMDAWEHAYMPDYALDRTAYIEAFFKHIDWEPVEARLALAMARSRPLVPSR